MRRIADRDDWGYTPIINEDKLFPKKSRLRISYLSTDRFGSLCGDRLVASFGPRRIGVRRELLGRSISFKSYKTSDFIGVAAEIKRSHDGDQSRVRVALYLMHENRALDLLLYEATHDLDIIAVWQFWSKQLKLPMLSVRPDGEIIEPFELMGMVLKSQPYQRSSRDYLNGRKPIFLAVRDVGIKKNSWHLPGHEIMARH